MAKKNNWIIVVGILILLFILTGEKKEVITCDETMERTGPLEVEAGDTFQIIYSVDNVQGLWGASIEDSVSGGCEFPSDITEYRTVMLSDGGTLRQITMTTPSSAGSCSFSGDYMFGTCSIRNLNSYDVDIVEPCVPSCNGLVCGDDGCDGSCGVCEEDYSCELGACVFTGCVPDDSCAYNTCIGESCTDDCENVYEGLADCTEDHCINGIEDYDETGIDCGGSDCDSCPGDNKIYLYIALFFGLIIFLRVLGR